MTSLATPTTGDVYVDDQLVGFSGSTFSVSPGTHTIYVASPLYEYHAYHVFRYYYYDGNVDYNNPTTLSVAADKTVVAYYYSYYY